MIHTTRPAAASAKCPNTTPGGRWLVRGSRSAPLAIQVPSMTKPPTAVSSHVTRAAIPMIISPDLRGGKEKSAAVTVGLSCFVGHPHAVVVGELAAEIPRHGE